MITVGWFVLMGECIVRPGVTGLVRLLVVVIVLGDYIKLNRWHVTNVPALEELCSTHNRGQYGLY